MTERRLKLWKDFASTFLFGARCSTSPWHEIYCKVQHVKMFYNLATCVQKMTIRANWHCVLHCMSPDSALVWPFLEKNNHQHTHTHTHTSTGRTESGRTHMTCLIRKTHTHTARELIFIPFFLDRQKVYSVCLYCTCVQRYVLGRKVLFL